MKRSLIVCFVVTAIMLLVCGLTTIPEPEPNVQMVDPVHLTSNTVRTLEERTIISAYANKSEIKKEQTKPPYVMYYDESDIVMLAKLMYQECGGVPSDTEKACVVWTVLNRVDEYGGTIYEVVTAKNQFAYYNDRPVDDALYQLAKDVLTRWNNEKNGEVNVGRVLPPDYLWFSGDGEHNHFRNAYKGQFSIWDYSLETPYES